MIHLQSVVIRTATRIQLIFDVPVQSGAYGAPAPAWYSVENEDGKAVDPTVQAALLVPNSSNVVELVLSADLVHNALYTVVADGVPGTDATSTSGDSRKIRWGLTEPKRNLEPIFNRREKILYFIDLFFDGRDFQETATGDLMQISGPPNVTKAVYRGIESNGLPWDPTYGAKARQFVDSPSPSAGTLKGSVNAQILRDPRVSQAKVTFTQEDDKTFLHADVKLTSGVTTDRVTVEVPNGN